MAELTLKIVTPDGRMFDEPIKSVSVPGVEGAFGVYKNHAPLVSLLTRGVVKVTQEEKLHFFTIDSGIFEVNHHSQCVLLATQASTVDSMEEAKSQLAKITK